MNDNAANERMRADWNSRAREDANYYAAFARRDQNNDEFLATAVRTAEGLADELERLPASINPRARRALEIGCGPGRLMRPMSSHFGEIHGVDISDEMVRLAQKRMHDIPHAHLHHTETSDLSMFADDSFDFVYSYAVFQHIPNREVVFQYFREIRRVLKIGGIARLQLNGLPESEAPYNTWHGVRISAEEVAGFVRENDFQLLALEGIATQYMWTTWSKRPLGWAADQEDNKPILEEAFIRRITNTNSSEPLAPTRGRFASISLWMENLPDECDLNFLDIKIGGVKAFIFYFGPPKYNGLRQVNAYLPEGLKTGLQPVEVFWRGHQACPPATLRLVPPGPPVPRVATVTDAVNLLSGSKIVTGSIKVVLEETEHPEEFQASLGSHPVSAPEICTTDPRMPEFAIIFKVPDNVGPGHHRLEMRLGHRRFAPMDIEVARPD